MRVPIAWLELDAEGLWEVRRLRNGEEERNALIVGNGFDLSADLNEQVADLLPGRLRVSRKAARWALRVVADVSG